MPKEEVLVGGRVELLQLGEEGRSAAYAFADEGLHLGVDGVAHGGFLLMVGDGEILMQQALQVLLAQIAVEAYYILRGGGWTAHSLARDAAEVETAITLN